MHERCRRLAARFPGTASNRRTVPSWRRWSCDSRGPFCGAHGGAVLKPSTTASSTIHRLQLGLPDPGSYRRPRVPGRDRSGSRPATSGKVPRHRHRRSDTDNDPSSAMSLGGICGPGRADVEPLLPQTSGMLSPSITPPHTGNHKGGSTTTGRLSERHRKRHGVGFSGDRHL